MHNILIDMPVRTVGRVRPKIRRNIRIMGVMRLADMGYLVSRHIMLHAVGNTAQQGQQQKERSSRFCHSYHGANAITEIAAMQTAMKTAIYCARISLRLTLRIKS